MTPLIFSNDSDSNDEFEKSPWASEISNHAAQRDVLFYEVLKSYHGIFDPDSSDNSYERDVSNAETSQEGASRVQPNSSLPDEPFSLQLDDPVLSDSDDELFEEDATGNVKIEFGLRSLFKKRSLVKIAAQRVKSSEVYNTVLFDLLIASKNNPDPAVANMAANAMTILNYANKTFSGMDLSNIRASGADLVGGVFDNTIFRGAILRSVNFSRSFLRDTDVDLSDSIFFDEVQAKLDIAIAADFLPGEEGVILMLDDNGYLGWVRTNKTK